jgi:diaminopimelate decarboxylase/aspartate kinase
MSAPRAPWWRSRAGELLALAGDGRPRYVYHLPTILDRARRLRRTLASVNDFYYSMKANSEPSILEALAEDGWGLECVSAPELARARQAAGGKAALLFLPSYCPLEEYAEAFRAGAEVILDAEETLMERALFAGREVGVRVDPGWGDGHHPAVVTGGAWAKFGVLVEALPAFAEQARRAGATVVGLHAHVGSGILESGTWGRVGELLAGLVPGFPGLRWVSLGGGLGVPEHPDQEPLDLARVEEGLARARRASPGLALRLEPGRYLVSEAGVLLAPVTQVRRKGDLSFVGVAAGMNVLLRPALYGAWHAIHNLSRLEEAPARAWQVVGPLCESGDVLGRDRRIPDPRPGDVLLIENAGAYGAVMYSRYNLREPAPEIVLTS